MTNTAVVESHYPLADNGAHPIPPSILPQVAPSTYLLSHLISPEQRRPSGRRLPEVRPLSLNAGSLTNANGSALVRIGNTSVVCGVTAEVLDVRDIANFRPKERPGSYSNGVSRTTSNEGFSGGEEEEDDDDDNGDGGDDDDDDVEIHNYSLLVPNIELQTGASPLPPYQPTSGAPSAVAQSLSQRLLSLLHSTRLIRSSDLRIYGTDLNSTIQEGSKIDDSMDSGDSMAEPRILKGFWTLYIDVLLLSHDGSIFDAAFMAVVSALRNTILPKAWYDPDREQIICSPKPEIASHLKLRGSAPIALSWRVFVDSESGITVGKDGARRKHWVLVDPDAFEEDSGSCRESGCIVVDNVTTKKGKGKRDELTILKLEKNGGSGLDPEDLEAILQVAGKRWKEWRKILHESAPTTTPTSSAATSS